MYKMGKNNIFPRFKSVTFYKILGKNLNWIQIRIPDLNFH